MNEAKSINLLNCAAGNELQAVHQCMYFHFHLADQGFGPLSMLFKRIAIMEMGHVELLAARVRLTPIRPLRFSARGMSRVS